MTVTVAPAEATATAEPPELLPERSYVAPRVNLMPPEIAERRELRRLQTKLAAVVMGCVGVVGLLYQHAHAPKAAAEERVQVAQAEGTRLQAELGRLAPVRIQEQEIQAAQSALRQAMSAEILYSGYLHELSTRLPMDARLASLAIAPSGASTAAPASPAPAGTAPAPSTGQPAQGASAPASPAPVAAPLGTVTFTGKAADLDTVADWLDELAEVRGLANPYLTTTTTDEKTGLVDFTVTAEVTADALSHRFDRTGD